MAEPASFIGSYRKGDNLQWPVTTAIWSPNFFDVYDGTTHDVVLVDRPMTVHTDTPSLFKFVEFQIDDIFDTDANRVFAWVEGRSYLVHVKDTTGVPANSFIAAFQVSTDSPQAAFLGFVEFRKNFYFTIKEENRTDLWFDVIDPKDMSLVAGNETMTGPTHSFGGNRIFGGAIDTNALGLVIGRTYWIRVKDEAVIDPNLDEVFSFTVMPELEFELKRLLSLGGENMVLDNFAYDQAGNIIGLRVRGFESAAQADAATATVTDPEPGELFSLNVDQEHDVARNVRTFHKSVREFISVQFPSDP